MRFLDLFSGIGGFALGLERAGHETVAFCEIEPFCRSVLAKHWPAVPCYEDIRSLTGTRLQADGIRVDGICGGFPCQPFSSAARGRHTYQSLWSEMLRVISEVRPRWVIGENVANFDRMGLEKMVSDLEAIDYEVAPTFEIPACAVGHEHRRTRLWIICHANGDRKSECTVNAEVAELSAYANDDAGTHRRNNGVSSRMDRLRALGNAVVPQIPEIIGLAITTEQ